MLEESKINVCARIKSVEVVVPDHQDYESSKFIVAQLGEAVLQTNQRDSEGDARLIQQAKMLKSYSRDISEEEPSKPLNMNQGTFDRFKLDIFDIRLLYLNSLSAFEDVYLYTDKTAEQEADKSAIINKFNVQITLDRLLQNKAKIDELDLETLAHLKI